MCVLARLPCFAACDLFLAAWGQLVEAVISRYSRCLCSRAAFAEMIGCLRKGAADVQQAVGKRLGKPNATFAL